MHSNNCLAAQSTPSSLLTERRRSSHFQVWSIVVGSSAVNLLPVDDDITRQYSNDWALFIIILIIVVRVESCVSFLNVTYTGYCCVLLTGASLTSSGNDFESACCITITDTYLSHYKMTESALLRSSYLQQSQVVLVFAAHSKSNGSTPRRLDACCFEFWFVYILFALYWSKTPAAL